MNGPLVTVIIPTYKRPGTLARAVESVRKQTYKNLEIIIVDDNNPGDKYRQETEAVMKTYEFHPNVKYIKHSENRNGSAARNTGIRNATGLYLSFLDDDDEFLPGKIEYQVLKLESLDESWGACYTNYIKVKDGKILQRGAERREGSLKKEVLMKNFYIYAGSNLLIRSAVLDKIQGFDERFRRNQDLEFLVRIMDHFKIAYVDSCSLIMHYDSRVTKLTAEDLTKINELFIESFKYQIENLPDNDRRDFYLMMDLDMFKFLLQNNGLHQAIAYVRRKKISKTIIVRYVYYLFHRKLTNKCYGFHFR